MWHFDGGMKNEVEVGTMKMKVWAHLFLNHLLQLFDAAIDIRSVLFSVR